MVPTSMLKSVFTSGHRLLSLRVQRSPFLNLTWTPDDRTTIPTCESKDIVAWLNQTGQDALQVIVLGRHAIMGMEQALGRVADLQRLAVLDLFTLEPIEHESLIALRHLQMLNLRSLAPVANRRGMDRSTLIQLAQVNPGMKELHLDIASSRLQSERATDNSTWRQMLAAMPRLSALTLTLFDHTFTLDELAQLTSVRKNLTLVWRALGPPSDRHRRTSAAELKLFQSARPNFQAARYRGRDALQAQRVNVLNVPQYCLAEEETLILPNLPALVSGTFEEWKNGTDARNSLLDWMATQPALSVTIVRHPAAEIHPNVDHVDWKTVSTRFVYIWPASILVDLERKRVEAIHVGTNPVMAQNVLNAMTGQLNKAFGLGMWDTGFSSTLVVEPQPGGAFSDEIKTSGMQLQPLFVHLRLLNPTAETPILVSFVCRRIQPPPLFVHYDKFMWARDKSLPTASGTYYVV
jgi:hypothetical protein